MQVEDLKFMKPVVAVQDDDAHWYVIPSELQDDFYDEIGHAQIIGYTKFNEKYAKYATGGSPNSVQLYARFPPK